MKDPSVVSTGACTTGPTKWDIYVSNQYIVATHRLSNVMEVPGREFLLEEIDRDSTGGNDSRCCKEFCWKGFKNI